MENIDCHSLLEHRGASFSQLDAVIKNSQNKVPPRNSSPFNVPSELLIPLQNLDSLLTSLFKETESRVNQEQQEYLIQCKRVIANFYCWIQVFFEVFVDNKPIPSARRIAYEFFFNTSYELRTHYYNLKSYAQAREYLGRTAELDEFIAQICSSPFAPENQDKLDQINFWSGELGKFMDDLPRLRQEFSDEDSI